MTRTVRLAAIGVLCAMAASLASPCASQETSRSLWRKRVVISKRLKQIRSKLVKAKRQERSVSAKLWQTESRIRDTRKRVSITRNRLCACRSRLAATRRSLQQARERLKRQNELLADRLADMYAGEQITYLNVLLGSTDMWTLLTRAYYIERIIASDVRLIRDIEQTKREIERQEAAYAQQTREVASLHSSLRQQQAEQYQLAGYQRYQLSEIEKNKELLERMLAELEAESERIAEQIRRLQQTPEGAKRLARRFTGGLSAPVAGRITSSFGYRMHPILHRVTFHTGVDLAARSGAPIRAAADGVVVMAGWYGAYGYTVVIDHGGGVSTLYGHCSSILVSENCQVRRGQTIARVGSTGWSTGPHLHFERRENGTPVNPF